MMLELALKEGVGREVGRGFGRRRVRILFAHQYRGEESGEGEGHTFDISLQYNLERTHKRIFERLQRSGIARYYESEKQVISIDTSLDTHARYLTSAEMLSNVY